jgi:hypothetical protein
MKIKFTNQQAMNKRFTETMAKLTLRLMEEKSYILYPLETNKKSA